MSHIQIVGLKAKAGIGKESKKPYNMLIAQALFVTDEGEVQVCEMMFMEGDKKPLPKLEVGGKYKPQMRMYVNQEKKLAATLGDLVLMPAVARSAGRDPLAA